MTMCPACSSEAPSSNDRKVRANCSECYVLSDTWTTEESRIRNCGCYAVGHDKTKLKGYEPLPEELLKLIEEDKHKETDQVAKAFYQEKLNKETEEDLKYAKEHPRSFDE